MLYQMKEVDVYRHNQNSMSSIEQAPYGRHRIETRSFSAPDTIHRLIFLTVCLFEHHLRDQQILLAYKLAHMKVPE